MKTFSEDDIHRSVKLSVWSGGEATNRRLDAAFKGIKPKDSGAFSFCTCTGFPFRGTDSIDSIDSID